MTLRPPAALALLWVLPCTLLGLALALPCLLAGARVRRVGRTLEVALRSGELTAHSALRRLPFAAITLGHVVLGVSSGALARLRPHEAVHVRQYERWGALFLLAYPAASLWAWLRGGCPLPRQPLRAPGLRRSGHDRRAGPAPCKPGGVASPGFARMDAP